MTGDGKPVDANNGEGSARDASTWRRDGDADKGVTFADVMQAPRDYASVHAKYDQDLDTYWSGVKQLRDAGQFTAQYPPVYDGPPKPNDGPTPAKKPSTLPSLQDMLDQSKDLNRVAFGSGQPDFDVQTIDEGAFKQRYARETVAMGAKYGLSKADVAQAVERVYRFEDGNWGTADTLSGMPRQLATSELPLVDLVRRNFHPASTAIGYNQVLMMTTTRLLDQHGTDIAGRLTEMANQDPARAAELQQKAKLISSLSTVIHKEVLDFAKANPNPVKPYFNDKGDATEDLYSDFAKSKDPTSVGLTGRQLATGLQALNIDGDIGPLIQTSNLGDLVAYGKQHGFDQLLDQKIKSLNDGAATYDALPQTDKAQAIDEVFSHIKTPASLKGQAATDFQNSIQSVRDKITQIPSGTTDVLNSKGLSSEDDKVLTNVLMLRKLGETSGELSAPARALLDKAFQSYLGNPTAADLRAASLELQNLAGSDQAYLMLQADHADLPTSNFFSRPGYYGNPVTNRRTSTELLLQIHRIMVRPGGDVDRPGALAFAHAFDQIQ